MDAIWYGIADFSEYVFNLIKPIGMAIDVLFVITGFIGTFFWLWYTVFVKKGGHNFMADSPGEKA
jgi:hypothetical protein